MASTIQSGDLVRALGKAAATFVAHIGPGATATLIPLADLNLGTNNLAGDLILIQAGALGATAQWDTLAAISSNTANTLTVPALSAAPLAGYAVWIFRIASIQAQVSENIAQVGGTAQTGADWTPLLQGAAVKQGTLTDRSGSITTGGTEQILAAINASRRYLLVQNPLSATTQGIATVESLFINFTTAAVEGEPSIELAPGDIFIMEGSAISTELISVIAATTGHKWAAKEM